MTVLTNTIDAAILAGGLGTRLRPVVADRPKALAEIKGRPFLSFLLASLCAQGIDRAVLCVGYKASHIQKAYGPSFKEMSLSYSSEQAPLGTGGALRLARSSLHSDPIIVLNGDSYCSFSLETLLQQYHQTNASALMLLTEVDDVSRFGSVVLDSSHRIRCFEEKGRTTGKGLINAGVYLISGGVLDSIPSSGPVSLEKDIFPRLCGEAFYGVTSSGPFIDIGTPESYADAERFFTGDKS